MGKKRRILEAAKTLLILALTASALYLVGRSRMFGTLRPDQTGQSGATSAASPVQAAQPLRMAVTNESGCYGVQYSSAESEVLFERMAPLLNEALSSAGVPVQVSSQVWERALYAAPGIYFDFQGKVPLQALTGWMSGVENPNLMAGVRHLLLAAEGAQVQLYYQDEEQGTYWSCPAEVVSLSRLESAVSEVTANAAFFAGQSETYSGLAACTLISAQTPSPLEYTVVNPLATDEENRMNILLEALSFPVGITSVYDTPEGHRARSGNDTLSISHDGVVTYHTTDGGVRYPVSRPAGNGDLFAAVESARQLAWGALNNWSGAARLYLAETQQLDEDSWRVTFDYVLDAVPVRLSGNRHAASVVVTQGNITEFELCLRSYAAAQERTLLLPEEQAVAALVHLGQSGSQLQLYYQDVGDTVRAGWVAQPQ